MATKKSAPVKKLSPKQNEMLQALKGGPKLPSEVDMRTAKALYDAGFVKLTTKTVSLSAAGTKRAAVAAPAAT
jgi:hypothetical protein